MRTLLQLERHSPIVPGETTNQLPDRDSSESSALYLFRNPQLAASRRWLRSYTRYYSDNAIESIVAESGCSDVPELAAIILSRTQLKRGHPELALELLQSFVAQYGESVRIKEEIARVVSALSRS